VLTYDYKCDKCGIFEKEQRITDPALEHCPGCGGPVKRLISKNVGIVFKGPGFYVNDSKKERAGCGSDMACNAGACDMDSCAANQDKAAC
jgi:putative FmdB family regulatory protein